MPNEPQSIEPVGPVGSSASLTVPVPVARLLVLLAAERYAARADECRWEHDGPFHECARLEAAQRAYRRLKAGADA